MTIGVWEVRTIAWARVAPWKSAVTAVTAVTAITAIITTITTWISARAAEASKASGSAVLLRVCGCYASDQEDREQHD